MTAAAWRMASSPRLPPHGCSPRADERFARAPPSPSLSGAGPGCRARDSGPARRARAGILRFPAHADAPSSRRTARSGRGPGPGHLTYRRRPAAPVPCLEPLVATGAAKARLRPPRWLCERGRPLRCPAPADAVPVPATATPTAPRASDAVSHSSRRFRPARGKHRREADDDRPSGIPPSAPSWCRILGPPPYRRLTQAPRAGVAGATGQHGAVLDYCVGGGCGSDRIRLPGRSRPLPRAGHPDRRPEAAGAAGDARAPGEPARPARRPR